MDQVKNHLHGLPQKEKEQWLETHATKIEEGQYFRPYDGEDLNQGRADFTAKAIELTRIEAEFEEIKNNFKAKIKMAKAQRAILMQNLMQQGEWLDGKQYMFDDQEIGMMHLFDESGQIISSRRLRPEERQMNLFNPNAKVS
jgi:hypothetical protein